MAEIAHPSDLTISRKLYARFPKFGAVADGLPRREYAAELHMGNDREEFSGAAEGLPIYEGRMIEAFDHRAKAWVSGRGRAAVWRELPFGSPHKAISPQWRLPEADVPRKLGNRWRRYRIGFCDIASPTNQRAFVAAIIPPDMICGHSVSTVEFADSTPELILFLLATMNAFALDFVSKPKVSLHMSFTVVDSLPLPRAYTGTEVEREIVRRSLLLTATGPEMAAFWRDAAPRVGLDPIAQGPVEDSQKRRQLRAELDVLVARDIYKLTRDEMRYLIDPADILGADVGFETFGALKRSDEREFGGKFLTRDLILAAWDAREAAEAAPVALPATTPLRPHPSAVPAKDWERPAAADMAALRLQTRAQLAAIIKALAGPTPAAQVRLAALYALEPQYLTQRMTGTEQNQWMRAVGPAANPPATNVTAVGLGGATGWGEALQQLRGANALLEDAAHDTWRLGRGSRPTSPMAGSLGPASPWMSRLAFLAIRRLA